MPQKPSLYQLQVTFHQNGFLVVKASRAELAERGFGRILFSTSRIIPVIAGCPLQLPYRQPTAEIVRREGEREIHAIDTIKSLMRGESKEL